MSRAIEEKSNFLERLQCANPVPVFNEQVPLAKIRDLPDLSDLIGESVRLKAFDIGDAIVYSAHFNEAVLSARSLRRVLYLACPQGGGFYPGVDIVNILADWRIIEDQPEGSENRRLVELHKGGIGVKWAEFVYGDRPRFMRALTATDLSITKKFFDTLPPQNILTHTQAEARKEEELTKLKGQAYTVANGKELVGLLKFEELCEPIREGIERRLIERLQTFLSVVDPSVERVIYKSGLFEEQPRNIIQYNGGVVRFEFGRSWIEFDYNGEEPVEIARVYNDFENDPLVPWVVWSKRKGDGRRVNLDRDILGFLAESVDLRANLRLGLVLANALSPEDRDKLPAYQALEKDGFKQRIGEAQIPLFVAMHEAAVLQGSFFRSAEMYAGVVNISQKTRTLRWLGEKYDQVLAKSKRFFNIAASWRSVGLVGGAMMFASILDLGAYDSYKANQLQKTLPAVNTPKTDKLNADVVGLFKEIDLKLRGDSNEIKLPENREERESLARLLDEIIYANEREELWKAEKEKMDIELDSLSKDRIHMDRALFTGGSIVLLARILTSFGKSLTSFRKHNKP